VNAAALREENKKLREILEEKEAVIAEKDKQLSEIQNHVQVLEEKVTLLEILHFGPKSEKWTEEDKRQALLFNEAEDAAFEQVDETGDKSGVQKTDVGPYARKTHRNQGRKPISADLPREEIVYDIADDEKTCGCGNELTCIGEDVSERVKIKPAEVKVLREVRKKYACKKCEGTEDDRPGVVTAEGKKHLIPGSIADESLLAWSVQEKFEFSLPFYRQSKRLEYLGIPIPRSTLGNHAIKTAEACRPLYELLREHIRSGPLINADETRLQVLKEPERKAQDLSWMWVFAGGPPGKEAVVFQYDPSRSSDVPMKFLAGYTGWLQTDDYAAYHTALKKLAGTGQKILPKHVLCWAHARREFHKVWESSKSEHARQALDFIRELFALENLRKDYSEKGFLKQRKNRAELIFERFRPWLTKLYEATPPKGALGKALRYILDNWEMLILYVEDSILTPSNNRAENAIRPFVIGRKNWLFSGTPSGAEASAIHYSLIETAKLNKLNPYEYLSCIYSRLPYAVSNEDITGLLPFNITPEMLKGG
jgi:transposase